MPGQDLFLRDKELAAWWASISHDERFEKVFTFVESELFHSEMSFDQMKGAEKALQMFATFSDKFTVAGSKMPSPGLIHQSQKPVIVPKPTT